MRFYGPGAIRRSGLFFILAATSSPLWLGGCASTHATERSDPSPVVAADPPAAPKAAPASPAAAPHSASDQSPDARPVIVCFGDSLTAGYGAEPGQSYPDDLQQRLDAAGYHYRVINEGVSGNTTKDGLARLQSVIAKHPQIVVVEFGGNDGLRGLPVSQAERNIATMVSALQKAGAKVALAGITLPPQYGEEYIDQFNAMFPTLARRFHTPLLPFILQDVYGVPGDIQADGVHATEQGNKQVAANIEKLIQPLLQK